MSLTYTPLKLKDNKKSSKTDIVKFVGVNIASIGAALMIVLGFYIYRQISIPQTNTSKASAYEGICYPLTPRNPTTVKAYINAIDINYGDEITDNEITFEWEPVSTALSYYAGLSADDPKSINFRFDPAEKGFKTNELKYTFKDLKPNTTYYFYVRSFNKGGRYGFVFPTPGNCDYGLVALPLFKFSVK